MTRGNLARDVHVIEGIRVRGVGEREHKHEADGKGQQEEGGGYSHGGAR